MKFSKRLKQYRKRKGLSQAQLAAKAGVSQGDISRYENGEVMPRLDRARQIANVLGISLDELAG